MLNVILFIFVLFCMLYSIVNLQKGLILYIVYILCVPFVEKNVCGIPYNIINLFFLLIYIFKVKFSKKTLELKPFIPFLLYYLYIFIFVFFQPVVPKEFSFHSLFPFLFITFIFPMILYKVVKIGTGTKMLQKTILGCMWIALVYGLLLILFHGHNPYLETLSPEIYDYVYASNPMRIFGRIYGVFRHPMTFGFFIICSAVFLHFIYNHSRNHKILVSLLVINIITCGVRTVIFALIVIVAFTVLREKKNKIFRRNFILYSSLLFVIVFVLLFMSESFNTYVMVIINALTGEGVQTGSNLAMRLVQLQGAFDEIKQHIFIGLGYNWVGYYWKDLPEWSIGHPTMLSFESLLLILLCNSGILGTIMYAIQIILIYKIGNKYYPQKSLFLNELLVGYIAYSLFTGEYGYLRYFLIFYISIILIPTQDETNNRFLSSSVSPNS